MGDLLLVMAMAAVTFLIRSLLVPLSGRVRFPVLFKQVLVAVPPVVLTALIIPSIFFPIGGGRALSYTNPYLIGGLVTLLVGWFSENLLASILAGLASFFCWKWLLAGI